MPKKENVALIGYGYWGKKLYKYLKKSERFNLSYVFFPSLNDYDRKSINQKFGKEFVTNIDIIWQDTDVPNVVIATPIDTHYKVASCALSHYKNVLVEKPLAIEKKEIRHLAQMAQKHDLILETEYTYTYSAALKQAKKMVSEGAIGDIQSIYICFKQLGRFLRYDVYFLLGSHALSILDLFLPLTDFVFSSFPIIRENGIVTSAIIQFKSGKNRCRGYIDINLHCPQREKKVIIFGKKGNIEYAPEEKDILRLSIYKRTNSLSGQDLIEKTESFQFDESHNLKNALENFYELIQHKGKSNIDRALAVNSVLESLKARSS